MSCIDTIIIDLGTTTIGIGYLSKNEKTLCDTDVMANPHIPYGADIVSRIEASANGHLDDMRISLTGFLTDAIKKHIRIPHEYTYDIKDCYIAGNTAMTHILMGYECKTLSAYPFGIEHDPPGIIQKNGINIHILPWYSAYVGGDLRSGIYACHMERGTTSPTLLIDLGTNGELILSANDRLYGTATAAGPAFEGGNLTSGCPGIPGAIYAVKFHPLQPELKTINDLHPVGLCGSGAISVLAELIRCGYVKDDTTRTDKFPDDGIKLIKTRSGKDIVFTPDDMHSLILAKAAIAAGIETLSKAARISVSDIDKVYLAGGMGYGISVNDAEITGLFAGISADKVISVGNTSLKGLVRFACENIKKDSTDGIMHTVNLGTSDFFKDRYIEQMRFV